MTSHPAIQNAALALTLGWDPIKYLSTEGVERIAAEVILGEAMEVHAKNMEAQARFIVVELGKMLSGK